jgi:CheY-like chemotaxis protein
VSAPASLPRGEGQCILVVDDEVSIRSVARQTLEAFGYTVLDAEDGAQAIAIFAQNLAKVRMVLTDITMPVLDGPSLVVALRRLAPEIPIAVMSGLDANGKVARAIDSGVLQFLQKPFTTEALLRLVRDILPGPPGQPG